MKIPNGPEPNQLVGNTKLLKNIGRSKSYSSFTTDIIASNEMASKGMKSLKNGQPNQPNQPNNETRSGRMKKNNEYNRGGGQIYIETGGGKKNPSYEKETARDKTFSRSKNAQNPQIINLKWNMQETISQI